MAQKRVKTKGNNFLAHFQEVRVIAMTRIGTAILGPIAGSAKECMNNGWEKTVRNLAICVAVGEVSYFKLKLLGFK